MVGLPLMRSLSFPALRCIHLINSIVIIIIINFVIFVIVIVNNDDNDKDDKGGSLEGRPLMGLTMGTQRQLTPRVRLYR